MGTTAETLHLLDSKESEFGSKREKINWQEIEAIEKELADIVPKKNYGLLSGAERTPSFLKGFRQALEAGEVESYIESHQDLSTIYVANAVRDEVPSLSTNHQQIWEQRRPLFLLKTLKKIRDQLAQLEFSDFPEPVKKEYQAKLEGMYKHAKALFHVGKPEFVRRLLENEIDIEVFDFPESTDGQLRVKYVKQAKGELDSTLGQEQVTWFKDIGELIDKFRFTQDELAFVGLEDIDRSSTTTNFEVASKLCQAWFNRSPEFSSKWKINAVEGDTMSANAKAEEINIPENIIFSVDRLAVLLGHEGFHALRGANGGVNGFRFTRSGVENYLADEEGGASLMEMVLGEPRGHQRQIILAARSYAIDMALQTTTDDQSRVIAKYSIQEIYDELCKYGLDTMDSTRNLAAWIVERIFRGTDYKRQVVTVDIPGKGIFQVPEVVCKDAIYYVGILDLFKYLTDRLPVIADDPAIVQKVLDGDISFKEFAFKLGRQIINDTAPVDRPDTVEYRNHLEQLGEEALLSILQLMSVGKVKKEMVFEDSDWSSYLLAQPEQGIVFLQQMMFGIKPEL